MNYIGSKTLETERLVLKKSGVEEQKRLWEILCIPEVHRYYLTCKFGFDWEGQRPYFEKKAENSGDPSIFQWSIFIKDNNKCIGQISVQSGHSEDPLVTDDAIRGIGWFIDPEEQGKGYATEAATKVLDYMFNEVEIDEIRTGAAVVNPASYRLMEKIGFRRRGDKLHKTKYTFVEEEVDSYSYGLTKDEYKEFIGNKVLIK